VVAPFQDVTPVRLEIKIYSAKEVEKPKKMYATFPFFVGVVKEKIIAFSHYY